MSDTLSNTRGIGAARRWIYAEFQRISKDCGGCLEVRYIADIQKAEPTSRIRDDINIVNVVAIQRGTAEPNRYVMLAGDIDSRVSDVMNATADSPGANDNASGIAAGLELAAQLAHSPLQHHEVYLVFTGGGEAACTGADAFIREHLQKRVGQPIHFVINRIAGSGTQPTLVQREQFLRPAISDADLLQLAEQVRVAHPDLQAQVKTITASYSELSVGARHGLRTLGFTSLPANGAAGDSAVPHWHQAGDTVANCDLDVAARTLTLMWDVLQAVDAAPTTSEAR